MNQSEIQDIDLAFNKFIEYRTQFNLTVIELIEMVNNASDADEMMGQMRFYAQIVECIQEGDLKSVSYEERKQFLIFHKSLLDLYKNKQP